MYEAVVALLAAVLILGVFKAPHGLIRLGEYGGLAFVLYVGILLIEFVLGRVRN